MFVFTIIYLQYSARALCKRGPIVKKVIVHKTLRQVLDVPEIGLAVTRLKSCPRVVPRWSFIIH